MKLRSNSLLILTFCVLINFLLGFKHTWSILVPYIEGEFNIPRSLAVLPFSTMSITNIVGFLGIDYVKLKIGLRRTLIVITITSRLGLIMTSISQDILMLTISYACIYGVGHALGYVLAVTISVKWYYNTRRGLAAGLTSGGYSLGTLVLAPLTSYLIYCFGWRVATLIIGLVSLAVMVVATLIIDEPLTSEDKSARDISPTDLLKNKYFYVGWFMIFLTSLIDGFMISHLTPFMMRYVGATALAASLAISIYSIVNLASRVVIGGLSQSLGIFNILMVIYAISTLNTVLFPTYRTLALAYVGSSIIGLVHGTNVALTPLIAASMGGSKYLGSNYGLLLTAATVSMLVGPLIGGLSYDLTGSYDVGLHLLSITSALGIPLLMILRKKL